MKLKLLAAICCALFVAGCSNDSAEAPNEQQSVEQTPKAVKVMNVTKQKIGEPLEQLGDIAAFAEIDIIAKVGGDVKQVFKSRGDVVQKGDVIAILDQNDMLLERNKAVLSVRSAEVELQNAKEDISTNKADLQASIAKTEEALRIAEKNYAKMKIDYEIGAISRFEFEQSDTELRTLEIDLENFNKKLTTLEQSRSLEAIKTKVALSRLSLEEADRTLANMEIRAPISGILTDLGLEQGMTIPEGFQAGTIQQLDKVKITAGLTETDAKWLRGKTEVKFRVSGTDQIMNAEIGYLADVISAESKTYPLELVVSNKEHKLRPGMKAQILLTEKDDQQVIAVPALSLVREGTESFVFILVNDQVEKRRVELGRMQDTLQEVRSGIAENELLIIYGQHQLSDKERVQVIK